MAPHNRPNFAPALPQYLVAQQHQSTDSNDSVASVTTQIPRSYYDSSYRQHGNGFMMGNQQQPQMVGAPIGFDPNSFQHSQDHSSSLNPNSVPFDPSIYPSTNSMMPTFATQDRFGSQFVPGHAANSYYPPALTATNPQGPVNYGAYSLSQYSDASTNLSNPVYGQAGSQFQGNSGKHHGTYGMYSGSQMSQTSHGEHHGYGIPPRYAASPALSYISGQTSSYSSRPSSSHGQPTGLPYRNLEHDSMVRRDNHQPYPVGHSITSYGQMNAPSNGYGDFRRPLGIGHLLPANENRGRPALGTSFGSRSSLSSNNHMKSDSHAKENRQNLHQQLSATQPPSYLASREQSPEESANKSGREAAEERQAQPAKLQSDGIDKTSSEVISQPSDASLKSLLLSANGKNIGSTTPKPMLKSHKKAISSVGSLTMASVDGDESAPKLFGSPPKMASLLPLINQRSLVTIGENDPFAVRATPTRNQPASHTVPSHTLSLNPIMTSKHLAASYGLPTSAPMMSQALYALIKDGRPSFEDASTNLPLVEYCRLVQEDNFGVIKIKNIPYSVERSEVFAFLGRNARVVSETEYEPVHIVMERVTSKTLDCYVEFVNFNEAVNAVNRYEVNRLGGRGGRLGPRHVEVELSSQEQLMNDLFPKAKNVIWKGNQPIISPMDPNDIYNSGFQGFISKEEMVMLVKHVEAPQRSPFSKECPERPFECIISTLHKYPWKMVDYITIEDRELLHKATLTLLQLLRDRIENEEYQERKLNNVLYKRVWRAALKCPGFSPAQKDDFVYAVGLPHEMASELGVTEYAACWKTLWTIGPKAGAPTDLILYYAALIREYTDEKKELSLAERAVQGLSRSHDDCLFGKLNQYTAYPSIEQFKHLTLAQVAVIEWEGIEKVLRGCLTAQLEH